MNFFKTNAHWLALTAIAAASVSATVLLLKDVKDFPDALEKLYPRQVTPKKPAALDLSQLETATKLVASPGQWTTAHSTLLFVSEPYLMEPEGPKRPKEGSIHRHSKTGQAIPNSWFLQFKLPLRTNNISMEDSDGDGFTNEEEWLAGTDPTNPDSHPPLVTKLFFVRQVEVHNRVSFLQYLGEPSKPETLKITVRLDDVAKKPQAEVKIGDTIPGTEIKLVGFVQRRKDDVGVKGTKADGTSITVDGSLVNLADAKTGGTSDAEIKGRAADFVDKTITLHLNYSKENREMTTKPGQTVTLGASEPYTVIDSTPAGATLKNADGKLVEIRPAQSE